MNKHAWVTQIVILLISTSCGEAFDGKTKVENKRTKLSATGADAIAGGNQNSRNSATLPGGVTVPGSMNPDPSNPTNPANPTGNTGGGGGGVVVTPPPVDPGTGQTITLENGCYKGDQFLCQIEIALANKTNAYRAALGPLAYSSGMGWVARDWSQQMAANYSLGHGGFPAARYSKFSSEFGANAPVNFAAENVAYTYGTSTSPDEIANELMNLWITSTGHRDNMIGDFKTLVKAFATFLLTLQRKAISYTSRRAFRRCVPCCRILVLTTKSEQTTISGARRLIMKTSSGSYLRDNRILLKENSLLAQEKSKKSRSASKTRFYLYSFQVFKASESRGLSRFKALSY